MNILIINHYAGSKYHGMVFRHYYLAREWFKLGHKVTIVAADQSHLRQKKVYIPNKKSYLIENIDGINYLWLRTLKYEDNSLNRAFNIFSFIFQLFRYAKIISDYFKPDVIISSSTYPADIFAAYYISKLSNSKLIYEIRDLWPLSPILLKNYSKFHPFILAMQFAENFCYEYSDAVVSTLPKVSEHVCNHGLPLEKLYVIENGISLDEFNYKCKIPDELFQLIKQEKLKGNFIFGYAGNHTYANSLYTIIEAAEKLQSCKASIIFVGNGREKEKLIKLAGKKQLKNVYFANSINKEAIPDLLSHFDCLLITWKNLWKLYKYGISPNKITEYMLSGKPVIHAVNAGNDPVKDSGCGISILPENPELLAEAMTKIMNTSVEELNSMGKKGQEFVRKNYDYKILSKKYLNIIDKLAGSNQSGDQTRNL